MIKSHPLTLTKKAWLNHQKNICLFVWPFPSSLYYISGALPWYTKQLKPSAARWEFLLLSPAVIWMDLKGFSQAGSNWNLAGGFCVGAVNTNKAPACPTHTFRNSHPLTISLAPLEMAASFLRSTVINININIIIGITSPSRGSCEDVRISSDLNHFDRLKLERQMRVKVLELC